MKNLIKHLIENNIDEIVSKSIYNCHVKGLHSIMLLECPEKTIRLYVCSPSSDMAKNYPERINEGMSLAFHPHHCNLTLHCVKGNFLNWEVEERQDYDSLCLDKYVYHSHIKEGEMSFEFISKGYLKTKEFRRVYEGQSVMMKANEIHSVACPIGEYTAWLVYEGKEDANYTSYCWTNSDPNTIDKSILYQKMTKEQIKYLLTQINLI